MNVVVLTGLRSRAHSHLVSSPGSHIGLRKPLQCLISSYPRVWQCKPYSLVHKPVGPRFSRRSGLDTYTLSIVFAVSAIGYFSWGALQNIPALQGQRSTKDIVADTDIPTARTNPDMPAQIPPGRPGNLSIEQEERLKELWGALFKLTEPRDALGLGQSEVQSDLPQSPTRSSIEEAPDGGKKRRRFGSLLGRKKHDDVDSTHPQGNIISASDSVVGDDKHGLGKEYKAALANQTPEQLRDNMWSFCKGDDPDALLLRYLRARKWDVQAALVMLVATIHWRADLIHLEDDVMRQGEAGAIAAAEGESVPGLDKKLGGDFIQQIRMGKSVLHGCDKEGRPLCYVRVKLHRAGEQSEAALERFTVWTIETARLMLSPPVDTAVIIFDMTDFSMANMDYTPVKFMIKVFEANYPESLGAVLVHKSPWLFHSIWTIIRGWLDPVVASKVHFTKDAKGLEEFIERGHIPKELGGEEEWEYKYENPIAGENKRLGNGEEMKPILEQRSKLFAEYERETTLWIHESAASDSAVMQKRSRIAEELRENYWRLDPYIRARSLYDRTGVLSEDGNVSFYPKDAPMPVSTSQQNGKLAGMSGMLHRSTFGGLSAPTRQSTDGNSIYYDAQSEID